MGYKVRQFDNPADVFMRCLSINYPKNEEDENKITKLLHEYNKEMKAAVLNDDKNFTMPELDLTRDGNLGQMAPFGLQMKMLHFRNKALLKREPQAGRAKIFNSIFSGVLILAIYWQCAGPTITDITNFTGAIFFWLVGILMSSMFNTILVFQAERDVFLRENANQMYSLTAYYLSKNVIELPTTILIPGIQLAAIYWAIGFRSDNVIPEFFQVWLIGFLVA